MNMRTILLIPMLIMLMLLIIPLSLILLLHGASVERGVWAGGVVVIGPFPIFFQGEGGESLLYLIPLLLLPLLIFLITLLLPLLRGRKPRGIVLE